MFRIELLMVNSCHLLSEQMLMRQHLEVHIHQQSTIHVIIWSQNGMSGCAQSWWTISVWQDMFLKRNKGNHHNYSCSEGWQQKYLAFHDSVSLLSSTRMLESVRVICYILESTFFFFFCLLKLYSCVIYLPCILFFCVILPFLLIFSTYVIHMCIARENCTI